MLINNILDKWSIWLNNNLYQSNHIGWGQIYRSDETTTTLSKPKNHWPRFDSIYTTEARWLNMHCCIGRRPLNTFNRIHTGLRCLAFPSKLSGEMCVQVNLHGLNKSDDRDAMGIITGDCREVESTLLKITDSIDTRRQFHQWFTNSFRFVFSPTKCCACLKMNLFGNRIDWI